MRKINNFAYNINAKNEVTILDYKGKMLSVVIPSEIEGHPVKYIAHEAFMYKEFTNITIPDTVISIGWGAFEGCTKLTSIAIPKSVISIDAYAFSGCDSLKTIDVDENNKNYASQDGILLSKDKTRLICCPGGISGDYTIPDEIITVADYAFQFCNNLSSVNFSNNIKHIGRFSFSGCENITSLSIPSNVVSMGEGAFSYCENLNSVTISNGLKRIEPGVFEYCSNLKNVTLGHNITCIDGLAFNSCQNLETITIPDNVTSIGYDAFYRHSSDLIIKCNPGSYAEQWAIKKGFKTNPAVSKLQELLNNTNYSFFSNSDKSIVKE